MTNLGSKYRQLELDNLLGAGVCFVLPTNIGESNWTKILTKSTERYRAVVNRLGQTEIPRLSIKYGPLREKLVGAKMAELRSIQNAVPPYTAATYQQLFPASNSAEAILCGELPDEMNFGHGTMDYSQFGS